MLLVRDAHNGGVFSLYGLTWACKIVTGCITNGVGLVLSLQGTNMLLTICTDLLQPVLIAYDTLFLIGFIHAYYTHICMFVRVAYV